jgi:hypothetical protein
VPKLLGFLKFEQIIECGASVVGASRRGGGSRRGISISGRRSVARNRYTRLEKFAFVRLIFHGDTNWNGLQTLEAGGRLKVSALLAAVQRCSTFRAASFPIHVSRQGSGAAKTTGSHYVLQ